MKKIKIVLVVAIFSLATLTATANSSDPKNDQNKQLRKEIVQLLGKNLPEYLSLGEESLKTKVSFMINNNNEIVVFDVRCQSENLESYIKSKLNYEQVTIKGIKKGEVYHIPLTIKKS